MTKLRGVNLGGYSDYGSYAGVFAADYGDGDAYDYIGFRVVQSRL